MKGPGKRFALLAVFYSAFIFSMTSAEGAPGLTRIERAELAQKVKGIFERKCAKCHMPDGSERKNYLERVDIDFILDLEKISSYPEIIVRGNTVESMLYLQVESDTMPLSEVGEKPLPEDEKRSIKLWVEAGAPNEKGVVSTLVR